MFLVLFGSFIALAAIHIAIVLRLLLQFRKKVGALVIDVFLVDIRHSTISQTGQFPFQIAHAQGASHVT